MMRLVRGLLVLLAIGAVYVVVQRPSPAPRQQPTFADARNNALASGVAPIAAPSRPRLIDQRLAAIPLQPKWWRIEIEKAEAADYSATLWYRDGTLVLRGEPEADGKNVVRAILVVLRKQGVQPAAEPTKIQVQVMRHEPGETGARREIDYYGFAAYDYRRDAISYTACDGKGWFGC